MTAPGGARDGSAPAGEPGRDAAAAAALPVTLRDVAAAAGVSLVTASRALKHQRGLSDDTRRRVRQAARSLGYDPMRLRGGLVRRLVFLVHRQHGSFVANPFFSHVLEGVEAACREHGVAPTLLATGPADPLRDQLRLHEPAALLVAGFFEPELLRLLADLELPMVLIDGALAGLPSVNPDNVEGGRLATAHLLAAGRRRIAYLGGSLAHFSIRSREQGYRRALFDAGVLADPDLDVIAPPGLDHEAGAAAAMRQLLRLRPRPDAVFAYNDSAALAALRVCGEAGLRVPDDVALVGFDDIPAAAAANPPLSTVRVDRALLGRTGVELLMRGGELPREITLPVELVVRESSGIEGD